MKTNISLSRPSPDSKSCIFILGKFSRSFILSLALICILPALGFAQCVTLPNTGRIQGNDPFVQPINWADSNLVPLSDDNYASTSLNVGDTSKYLTVRNMGFWFPFTITVVGIQVYVERSSSLGAMVADGSVRLLKNGVFSGDDKASPVTWGKIDQVVSYGGPGDLWNETWTMADILSPNFGFGVSATSYAGAAGQTAYIDYMAMQVYYMGGPGCLLSVTLEAFDVQIDADGNVQANWLTATENDNDYFTLERSQDGVEFQGASVISGAGNSNSPINYSVVDHNPISGLAFYRLKSTDFDGENSYSDVLSIDAGNNMEVEMTSFPNPASSEINIDLENPGANGFVGLYDLSRRMVRKVNTAEEQSFVKLEVADLPRGMYILMYHTTKGIKSQRLVLQ